MICECGFITKKRTFLDGIKSISGHLLVFRVHVNETTTQMFMKRCCFLTLIPPLYTFVDKSWLMYTNILIFDPKTTYASQQINNLIGTNLSIQNVVNVHQDTLDRLKSLGDNEFEIVFVEHAKLLASEYMSATSNLNLSYQKLIQLEQFVNTLKYKYSAVVHDNELLKSAVPEIEKTTENKRPQDSCEKCKQVDRMRLKIKEIRKDTFEKFGKTHYELEITRKRVSSLWEENTKLQDEIVKLTDMNISYYMNH